MESPPKKVLIDAALTGSFHNVVARYLDGKWGLLSGVWSVSFEEIFEEAKRRSLECFVVTQPRNEGYWLSEAEQGFSVYYYERGQKTEIEHFPNLEQAFCKWLYKHLENYQLKVRP